MSNVVKFPTAQARDAELIELGARFEPFKALSLAQFEALPWEEKRVIAAQIEARIESQLSGLKKQCFEKQRDARRKAWRKASIEADFWEVSLRWYEKVILAQENGVAEALKHKRLAWDSADRWALVKSYEDAVGTQLLTPAPDLASVEWKRKERRRAFVRVPVAQLDRAIADDLAWLEKYPARERRVRRPAD